MSEELPRESFAEEQGAAWSEVPVAFEDGAESGLAASESMRNEPAGAPIPFEPQPAGEYDGGRFTGNGSMCLGFPGSKVERRPNLGDALLFALVFFLVLIGAMGGELVAIHFHWFGLKDLTDAAANTGLTLAVEVVVYGITLAVAIPMFRMLWSGWFFAAIHWHGGTAYRRRFWLIGAALACNVLALLAELALPFPKDAPVDKLFDTSVDAWLMFVFGVTVAPFFEEMMFRGFLLPAMATAWDWCGEKLRETPPKRLDSEGNPVWSAGAMIAASLLVSAPFAWMHGEQVANAWGPLILLYCVSLILCAVRLATRSLAASTLVHSAYNFLLFSLMLAETGGFRHMDKL